MGFPVLVVCKAAKDEHVFIQLEDVRNIFPPELLRNIRAALSTFTLRTYAILRR